MNILLDTLLRPHGDTGLNSQSCIEWHHEPLRAVPHVVLGDAPRAGGQWADNPVTASWDIGTLSYAEQLSLPGYTFADHWLKTKHELLPELIRPTRKDVAGYLASYPAAVGIEGTVKTSSAVSGISRTLNGFYVASHHIHCKHLVLASGVFNISVPPPQLLKPLLPFNYNKGPVLVIGSGFTAADIIISTPPNRKIIHLFNWDPERSPSPLQGCHSQAYPEYAGVYKQMKLAAVRFEHSNTEQERPKRKSRIMQSNLPNFSQRDWSTTYEGFPNTRIISVSLDNDSTYSIPYYDHFYHLHLRPSADLLATVHIGRSASGETITRTLGSFHYAAGRRGSLSYLSSSLLNEVTLPFVPLLDLKSSKHLAISHHPRQGNGLASNSVRRPSIEHDFALDVPADALISGQTLRSKIEALEIYVPDGSHVGGTPGTSMEVAPNVFVIGSLTGDSLIRFACGGCAVVAGCIMDDWRTHNIDDQTEGAYLWREAPAFLKQKTNGISSKVMQSDPTNGHVNGHLGLDRRKDEGDSLRDNIRRERVSMEHEAHESGRKVGVS